jgi:hypothetical protein
MKKDNRMNIKVLIVSKGRKIRRMRMKEMKLGMIHK